MKGCNRTKRSKPLASFQSVCLRWRSLGCQLALLATAAHLYGATVIGVIGDYGSGTTNELNVSALVKSWGPDFILTVGDNNYSATGTDGDATTIDANVGQFFHEYIFPYPGAYGSGASSNRFWPCLGNHDLPLGASAYLNYFTLPNNERYYNYRQGNVEIFGVNANSNEPDGYLFSSVQGQWLQGQLAASTALWRLVFFHESPYSSGLLHGTYLHQTDYMMWPFREWGANAVLSGHDHIYERIFTNGLTYFVNGVGGGRLDSFHYPLTPGSQAQFSGDYGALRLDATDTNLFFQFINWHGMVIDTYQIEARQAQLEPAWINGQFQVRLSGTTNRNYILDASADLVRWTVLSTNMPIDGSRNLVDPDATRLPFRFYRARTGR